MVGTAKDGSKNSDTTSVKLPNALAARIDAVWPAQGYVSRADYIRAAIQRQLEFNEVKL